MTNIARDRVFETLSEVMDATAFLSLAYGELLDLFGEYESIQTLVAKHKVVDAIFQSLRGNI